MKNKHKVRLMPAHSTEKQLEWPI